MSESKLTINRESLPTRCEICHQADQFDPVTAVCRRCAWVQSASPQTNLYPSTRPAWLVVGLNLLILVWLASGLLVRFFVSPPLSLFFILTGFFATLAVMGAGQPRQRGVLSPPNQAGVDPQSTVLADVYPWLQPAHRLFPVVTTGFILMILFSLGFLCLSNRGACQGIDSLPVMVFRDHYFLAERGNITEVSRAEFLAHGICETLPWFALLLLTCTKGIEGSLFERTLPLRPRADLQLPDGSSHPRVRH